MTPPHIEGGRSSEAGTCGVAGENSVPRANGLDRRASARTAAALERELRARERTIDRLEQRLNALERSAALVIGRALVDAARAPRTGVRQLPRTMYQVWRRRSREPRLPATGPTAGSTSVRGPGTHDEPAARMLAHTTIALSGRDRPVVAGILTHATAVALAGGPRPGPDGPVAVVNPLLPHDARALVEATDPDVLLIEAAALLAPGPWAYTGEGSAPFRDRAAHEAAQAAHSLGRHVVLWRNAPRHHAPGLAALLADTDTISPPVTWTVQDWAPGTPAPHAAAGRQALLDWFTGSSPLVRSMQLCTALGLPYDPARRRDVAVLAHVPAGELAGLAVRLLDQLHRPAEVVLALEERGARAGGVCDTEAMEALEAGGIRVTHAPAGTPLSELARLALAPWVACGQAGGGAGPTWLAELLARAEASGADAVGTVGAASPGGTAGGLLEPAEALVRRDLAGAGAGAWAARATGLPTPAPAAR